MIVESGLVGRPDVERAAVVQRRTGSRLGDVLWHGGLVDEHALARAVATHRGVPLLDDDGAKPDLEAVELIPERLAREHRVVPLCLEAGKLVVAGEDELAETATSELRRHADVPVRFVITTRTELETLRCAAYGARHVEIATTELLHRAPEECAHRVVSRGQRTVLLALAILALAGLALDPIAAVVVFNVVAVVFYTSFSVYKLVKVIQASGRDVELTVSDDEVRSVDEATLPVYTILVPLYREASVLPRLVASIDRLDYPRTKLDIKLLLEEDDAETIREARRMRLPAHYRLVVVPDSLPRTKPRACNYGLLQADGERVVIYDAEDAPEPDQLKKAVIAFGRAGSRVQCLQCKLNYFNAQQNLLTRWFTTEYSMWFDLLMPGLDAAGVPVPLGGTSNHFYKQTLLELGAWDPFNVTEDADLGIRLHKHGVKTAILNSTTYEEANSKPGNWVRQRSRWIKGYIQTWLVHMRHPVLLWRQLGFRSWFAFQMVIGGTFFGFLLNPIYWLLTVTWLLTELGVIREVFPGFLYFVASAGLVIGNFAFVYANVLGSLERGYYGLVRYALLSPVYWVLMSVAAWKGLLQLFFKPFYWEKTVHGLDTRDAGDVEAPSARESSYTAEQLS